VAYVVKEYSRLQLKFAQDRLLALSGLAVQMQARTGDTYLSGLWRSSLLEDLPWYLEEEELPIAEKCLPGPSWLWALVPAAAYYGELKESSMMGFKAPVLDTDCELASNNPTRAILSGQIKLCGKIVWSNIEKNEENNPEDYQR
jgi:hypothetical protein